MLDKTNGQIRYAGGISTGEISVIVQGGIGKLTEESLRSLVNALPGAEIILSTWKGMDTGGLHYDKLVLSQDPGAVYCDRVAGTLNNVNRQLVSTQAGLRAATRPYILKTRTDILFENAEFLSYFQKYDSVPQCH